MNENSRFTIIVSYCQIVLFDASCDDPFNDWTPQHSAQGFSWRPDCVGFGTLEEFGEHTIVLDVFSEEPQPSPSALRVIDVPFQVPPPGRISVCSISEGVDRDLAPGLYQLRFENFETIGDEAPKIYLSFWPSSSPTFKIVRADAGLNPGDTLLLTAAPALPSSKD